MNVSLILPLIVSLTAAAPAPVTVTGEPWVVAARPASRTLPIESQKRVAGLLGERRLRDLRQANFHIHRFSYDPTRDLADAPYFHEEVKDIVRSNFFKLVRESVEQALDLEGRFDRMIGREPGNGSGEPRRGFDYSPQLRLASDSALGIKLRWGSENRLLDHSHFELRRYLASDSTLIRIGYERGDDLFLLEHRMDDPRTGDAYSLLFRTSF